MSSETLPFLLGAGSIGGILWYGANRKAHASAMAPDRQHAAEASAVVERPNAAPPVAIKAAAPAGSTSPVIRPPERVSASAAANAPMPLSGRWVWPVETYNGRRSVITNPWSTRESRLHKGVDIMFPRAPGDAAHGRPGGYPPAVERWRPLVAKLARGLDVDFLLTWIQLESGGNPCATGIANKEAGLFQSYHPADDRHGATFEALRAACALGQQTASRPLTDAEQQLQVSSGIALARACLDVASSALKAIGAYWSPRDRYCLAKLVHALPAYVYRFPAAYVSARGKAPVGWGDFRAWVRSLSEEAVIAIDRGVQPWSSVAQRDRLFDLAERAGNAAAGGHPQFTVPEGVRALAASDGVVWSAARMPRGFTVVLDHGPAGYATFYTHFSEMFVAPTQRAASKERVYAGQPIGVVGADPMDPNGLPHLHFELWKGGPGDAVDPGPLMKWWEHIAVAPALTTPAGHPPASSASANPAPTGTPPIRVRSPGFGGPSLPIAPRPSTGARNASLAYRSVGQRGEPYPDWVRALDGKSGVYVIREFDANGEPEIVYVGSSSADRLYSTLTRHFQSWRRSKAFWRGQYNEGHDPGLTYDRDRVDAAVRITRASQAIDEEARLIRRLRPRDNLIGQPEEEVIPF